MIPPITHEERKRIRRVFTNGLLSLASMDVYVIPESLTIMLRRTVTTRPIPIPAAALLVGRYAHPCDSNQFLSDLDDLLALLEAQAAGYRAA